MRVDKRRAKVNAPILARAKGAVKKARAEKTPEVLKQLYSALDKAVGKHLISKNRASRLKSRIVKAVKK